MLQQHPVWIAVMTRAEWRCECRRACGRRLHGELDLATSRRVERCNYEKGAADLVVGPADPQMEDDAAARAGVEALAVWCLDCWELASTQARRQHRQRQEVALREQPALFVDGGAAA